MVYAPAALGDPDQSPNGQLVQQIAAPGRGPGPETGLHQLPFVPHAGPVRREPQRKGRSYTLSPATENRP